MDLTQIPSFNEITRLNDLIQDDEVVYLKDIIENKDYTFDRYKSGFKILDEAIAGGFKDGDLVVISGISGHGKTTLAQTMTYNMCKVGISCLWFSYEVSEQHLNNKFLNMGISSFYNVLTPKRNTTGKISWIELKIRESWIKYGTKVVFIDHIDFLTPDDIKNSDNQSIALKQIAIQLKSLAIELNVSIILMAHLKKLPEGKEPDMQDIGYSAGVYQLADHVIIVYREQITNGNKFNIGAVSGDIYTNKTIIKLVKNRETGKTIYVKAQCLNDKFIEETNEFNNQNASEF